MSSAPRLLIQVLPRLTPGRCGVSDHAIPLARELKNAFGIDTAFVVLNSRESCSLPYPIVHCRPAQLWETCVSLNGGGPGAVLVHVSGYGYAADGAPVLLAEALARVRSDGRYRIAAYFHELFATGMPWKSAFWYSSRQQRAVRKITWESDLIVTNIAQHASWLERQRARPGAEPVRLLPVFSNFGEALQRDPIATRDPVMLVVGLRGTRQSAYKQLRGMATTLFELKVQEVLDIGPEIELPPDLNGIPVKRVGMLSVSELAGRLAQSRFGFVAHTPSCLGKSTVFAAYCAFGTVPVIPRHFPEEIDGLRDGIHLSSPQTASAAEACGLEQCSLAAWRWYQGHRLHVHAATYARWLGHSLPGANQAARTNVEVKTA
jgi:hypothetical protein